MNQLFLAASGGGLGDIASSTAETFGISWQLFISQCISFTIVAALLYKFAYQPILKILAERRQTIADSLANAQKIKEELARTEAARKEVLEMANAQATNLIEEARAAATKVLEHESQKAIAQAEQIIAKAREAADADRGRMLAELRAEVGRLVVATTAKVTGKILTVDDQKRLADETNKQLAA
ncbi:MAG TPA: ATP synthase F0 subunit B [Verrucomicrobiales bacterium]|nr:ATP synthase F0 subunit B [Verrucomicrobiales bacterium]